MPPLPPRRPSRPRTSAPRLFVAVGLALVCGFGAADVQAQRPFLAHDALYRSETAERLFFDGYAFTAEVSYRRAGQVQDDGRPSIGANPLGLAFRLDYQLARRIDLSAIVDASGASAGASTTVAGRSLSVSWLALKYYWTVDNSDYAFRLAVDPSLDGRTGFSQTDFAFLASTLLSPMFSTDFAIGARRVQRGYERYEPPSEAADGDGAGEAPPPLLATSDPNILFTRAIGWELHLMMSYNVLLDPAKSNVFASLIVNRGQYQLSDFPMGGEAEAPAERTAAYGANALADGAPTFTREYRGGVVWVRTGVEYNRPGYQVAPFLNLPLKHWTPQGNHAPRVHFGVRLMLR